MIIRLLLCATILSFGLGAEEWHVPLDADAVKALEMTIADATAAGRWIKAGDETSIKMAMGQCDMFVLMLEKIRKMDARVLDSRKADIEAVRVQLVTPVMEYRATKEREEKEKWAAIHERSRKAEEQAAAEKAEDEAKIKAAAAEEANRRAERAAAVSAERSRIAAEERDRRTKEAQALGFKTGSLGICRVASDLMAQRVTLEFMKSTLVFPMESERFVVTGVLDGYAIYTADGHENPMQIAVIKKNGVYYGNGSPLGPDRLRFIEIRTFITVAMGNRDILVFAAVESKANP